MRQRQKAKPAAQAKTYQRHTHTMQSKTALPAYHFAQLDFPLLLASSPTAQGVHTPCPCDEVMVPAGQGWHTFFTSLLNLPASLSEHR